jgi:hypothetical protein
MAWIRMFCMCVILVKNLWKSGHILIIFKKFKWHISTFKMQALSQKQYLIINEVQVSLEFSIIGCISRPHPFFGKRK